MSASNYLENKLLDHMLGTAAFTMPAQVYVGLFTAAPSDAGGGTEASGGSYARQPADFDAAASGQAQNDGVITFPQATANWGTLTHWALFDAVSGGNMLHSGALDASRTINDTDQFLVNDGALVVTAD